MTDLFLTGLIYYWGLTFHFAALCRKRCSQGQALVESLEDVQAELVAWKVKHGQAMREKVLQRRQFDDI